jgi:hypothetical protein
MTFRSRPQTVPQYLRIAFKRPLHFQLNWAILLCDVIPDGKLSKLRGFDRQERRPQNCPFQSSFTQGTVQFTQGIPQFPLFTSRHHDGIISRHSASTSASSNSFSIWASHDICSISNTTSYSTFYAFFSSCRIALWPMWLANSKRQPCFYPP